MVYERFPVKSRLHGGWKGLAFNTLFVGAFNALPRSSGAALRLAPAGLLPQVAGMIAFTKAHAYGNDFLYVPADETLLGLPTGRGRGGSATAIAASAPTA